MTTLAVIAMQIGLLWLIATLVLWLVSRLLKAGKSTIFRAGLAATLIGLVGLAVPIGIVILQEGIAGNGNQIPLSIVAIGLVVQVPLSILLIWALLKPNFWRAAVIWLISTTCACLVFFPILLMSRAFAYEGFVVPTNSMAPTLVGWHKTATCPHCGGTMIVPSHPPDAEQQAPIFEGDLLAICEHCLQTSQVRDELAAPIAGDRFTSNKLLTPQRWDLIVFRYPPDPTVKYVARLVGMPGEKVFLKDGRVWADGARLTPPDAIRNIKSSAHMTGNIPTPFGSEDIPWQLKSNEVCVLGDFQLRSSDSRFWGPVPTENIEGVADLRYWPPNRFRILR